MIHRSEALIQARPQDFILNKASLETPLGSEIRKTFDKIIHPLRRGLPFIENVVPVGFLNGIRRLSQGSTIFFTRRSNDDNPAHKKSPEFIQAQIEENLKRAQKKLEDGLTTTGKMPTVNPDTVQAQTPPTIPPTPEVNKQKKKPKTKEEHRVDKWVNRKRHLE